MIATTIDTVDSTRFHTNLKNLGKDFDRNPVIKANLRGWNFQDFRETLSRRTYFEKIEKTRRDELKELNQTESDRIRGNYSTSQKLKIFSLF